MKTKRLNSYELIEIGGGFHSTPFQRLAVMLAEAFNAGRNYRHRNCDHAKLY